MSWSADFKCCVRECVPLAPLTWYKLGGPARWLIEPRDESELTAVLRRCADAGVEVRYLGKGANLLVSDDGVDGAVVRLTGPYWQRVEFSEPAAIPPSPFKGEGRGEGAFDRELSPPCSRHIFAAAGADLMQLVKQTAQLGLRGIEGLAGIPASIGGAIRMNCGGKYGEIGSRVKTVRVISPAGVIKDRTDVRFHYRSTNLGPDRILGVTLELTPDDPKTVYAEYDRIWREKTASQPALRHRSAGCVFRNPPGEAAGRLIDRCNLKGQRIGGAEVSPIHANFIVAHDGATSADVLMLADEVAQRVEASTGVRLELEVEVWGRPTPTTPKEKPRPLVLKQQLADLRERINEARADSLNAANAESLNATLVPTS